jgi:N-acetylglucosamine-6-phosphate deacetylase
VRLADGTLAGSALTLDQALRNLVQIGLGLAEASCRLASVAARYLDLTDRGRLVVGAFAACVVVDGELRLRRVLIEGDDIDIGAAGS